MGAPSAASGASFSSPGRRWSQQQQQQQQHHHPLLSSSSSSLLHQCKMSRLWQGLLYLAGFWTGSFFMQARFAVETGQPDKIMSLSSSYTSMQSHTHRISLATATECPPCDCSQNLEDKVDQAENDYNDDAVVAAPIDTSGGEQGRNHHFNNVNNDPYSNVTTGDTILAEDAADLVAEGTGDKGIRFPETLNRLIHGMGTAPRSNFVLKFDAGVPIDPPMDGNEEVLILYGSHKALPFRQRGGTNSSYPEKYDSVKEATENCDMVKVIYTDPKTKTPVNHYQGDHRQCIGIVGQWESPHVHKFRKKRTGRFEYEQSHHQPGVPSRKNTEASNKALQRYLSVFPDALERLAPLAEKAAVKNNIVVMVANYGQFHFFVNFICAASARNLDAISRVLLFATDEETYHAAQHLGVHVFYDPDIFRSIPKGAAIDYHDVEYGRIMMSKVYCVHMVNALGYDILFQDLDLVWYSDPFKYFKKRGTAHYDIYIQHDGLHHPDRFQPLAANTGFYYVKHSSLTEYFFSVFVRMGDLVLDDKSHQAAFTVLAKEHMSLRGLRVKVLSGIEFDNFLSGFHLHSRPNVMRWTRKGVHKPVMFHANWLAGADKLPALKETLNWFVHERCTPGASSSSTKNVTYTLQNCCMAKPFRVPGASLSTT